MTYFIQRIRVWLQRITEIILIAAQRAREERITQAAGSLTFTTVLSFVPIVTIALALFASFPLFKELRVAFEQQWLAGVLPEPISRQVVAYINQFAAKAKGLTALGSGFLIATAVSMMLTIDKELNQIWHVQRRRPVFQRVLVYWAVITLGPLLLGASLSATSYLRSTAQFELLGLHKVLLGVLPIILLSLAFAALYVLLPNRPVQYRHALFGGALAACSFELMKTAFAWYITEFPMYTAVYGAFAALPIFLLWIYLSWLVILFGAAITAALPSLRYEKVRRVRHPGERFVNALLLLRAIYQARQVLPQPGISRAQLMHRLHFNADTCDQLLDTLAQLGLVGQIEADSARERWVWVCDAESVTLGYLFEQLAFARSHFEHSLSQHFPQLQGWLAQLIVVDSLNISLAQIFD